jgi:hypothetical protein
LKLPPVTAAVLVYSENTELLRLKRALESALTEGRAPKSLRIFGPTVSTSNEAKLTLLVEPTEHLEVVSLLREINKRRAISKKSLLAYRVNPFSLD